MTTNKRHTQAIRERRLAADVKQLNLYVHTSEIEAVRRYVKRLPVTKTVLAELKLKRL
jgi:type VI protein secretion system component VasK